MTASKYRVELTQAERNELNDLVRRGRSPARKVKRALALLRTDQGLSDRVIAEGLAINPYTVARVRKRFCEEGLVSALTERPRPAEEEAEWKSRGASYRHSVQRAARGTHALDAEAARREGGTDGVRTEYLP